MSRRLPVLLLLALTTAGCGGAQGTSTDDFQGEQKRVAQVIADLSEAGTAKDGAEICSRLLAPALVDRLKAGDRTCAAEVEDALGDVDDMTLEVERVTITGATATARVKDGEDRVREVPLAKQGKDWKVTAF